MAKDSAHKITEKLFLGGYRAASDKHFVEKHNIGSILRLFPDEHRPADYKQFPGIVYLVAHIPDASTYNMHNIAVSCIQFIQNEIRKGRNVLVHCHMGISRSATIVLLYLMLNGMELARAYSYVKNIRPYINPNNGFLSFLKEMDGRIQNLKELRKKNKKLGPRQIRTRQIRTQKTSKNS